MLRCGAVRFIATRKRFARGLIRLRAAGSNYRNPRASGKTLEKHSTLSASYFLAAVCAWLGGCRVYVAAICNEAGSPGLPCREGGSVSLARHLSGAAHRYERHGGRRDGDAVRARGRDRAADGRAIRREHRRISRWPFIHQNGPARPQRPAAPRPRGRVAGPRGGLWSGARRALDHRRARSGPLLRDRTQRADARGGRFATHWEGPPARQAAALPFNAGWPLRGFWGALRLRVQPVRVDAHEQAADRTVSRRLPARGGPCGNQPS